jgi:hypothetical protein
MDLDDKKIQEFREVLRKIKMNILNNVTYKNQSTESLKQVTKQLIKFYVLLKPVIYNYKSINTILSYYKFYPIINFIVINNTLYISFFFFIVSIY